MKIIELIFYYFHFLLKLLQLLLCQRERHLLFPVKWLTFSRQVTSFFPQVTYFFQSTINNPFSESMLLSNFAFRWCLFFEIIYLIFRWYFKRFYSSFLIRCYYLVSILWLSVWLNFFKFCLAWQHISPEIINFSIRANRAQRVEKESLAKTAFLV